MQPEVIVSVLGHDNRRYTLEEVERARELAAKGDKAALALLASISAATPRTVDMMQLLHDCPECRAALERGEQPVIGTFDDLPTVKRKKLFPRRPRWR